MLSHEGVKMRTFGSILCFWIICFGICCDSKEQKKYDFPWQQVFRYSLQMYESMADVNALENRIGVFYNPKSIGPLEISSTAQTPDDSISKTLEEQEKELMEFVSRMNKKKTFRVGLLSDFLKMQEIKMTDEEQFQLTENLNSVGVVYAFSLPEMKDNGFLISIRANYFVDFDNKLGERATVSDLTSSNDRHILISGKRVNGEWKLTVVDDYVLWGD